MKDKNVYVLVKKFVMHFRTDEHKMFYCTEVGVMVFVHSL